MSIIHAARERKTLLCSFVRTGKSGYVLDGAFKPHLEKSLSLRSCSLDLSGPVCEFPAFVEASRSRYETSLQHFTKYSRQRNVCVTQEYRRMGKISIRPNRDSNSDLITSFLFHQEHPHQNRTKAQKTFMYPFPKFQKGAPEPKVDVCDAPYH